MKRKLLLNHCIRATLLITLFGIVTLTSCFCFGYLIPKTHRLAGGEMSTMRLPLPVRITDEAGAGIPGAIVMLKGTSMAASNRPKRELQNRCA
jgi:hypothetical protein